MAMIRKLWILDVEAERVQPSTSTSNSFPFTVPAQTYLRGSVSNAAVELRAKPLAHRSVAEIPRADMVLTIES